MADKNCIQIIYKKKGMKALLKKLEYLSEYQTTAGIHKGEGRKKVKSGTGKIKRGRSINIATLAKTLETDHDIIPNKDLAIPTKNSSETVFLLKGHSYHQPARYFIKLQNSPESWTKIKNFVRNQFLQYLDFSGRGKREGTYVFRRIGEFAETEQRSRIIDAKTAPNTFATSMIKGKNHPLLDEGDLLHSIDSKVTKQSTGRKVRFSKYADDIEKNMMSLNK